MIRIDATATTRELDSADLICFDACDATAKHTPAGKITSVIINRLRQKIRVVAYSGMRQLCSIAVINEGEALALQAKLLA